MSFIRNETKLITIEKTFNGMEPAYPESKIIAEYLRNGGEGLAVAAGFKKDILKMKS